MSTEVSEQLKATTSDIEALKAEVESIKAITRAPFRALEPEYSLKKLLRFLNSGESTKSLFQVIRHMRVIKYASNIFRKFTARNGMDSAAKSELNKP